MWWKREGEDGITDSLSLNPFAVLVIWDHWRIADVL